MFGAVLAFASAAFFGLNNATVRRGVLKSTVLQGMAITVPLGVPFFALFAALMGGYAAIANWSLAAWGWMSLAGVVHFVVGRYGNYRTTQALGATLSTPVQQLSILIALVMAYFVLGETVNSVNVFGILLVLLGPAVVMKQRKANTAAAKAKGFTPEYLPGFFWGLVCAVGYGSSPILISLGLGATGGLADSVGGVLVSYVAASLVVLALVMANGGPTYMRGMDKSSGKWFMISTVLVALSQLFRYLALAVAPISVVVPVQRLSVVFRILFNGMINRDHEVMDKWVITSIGLALLGVMALSLQTEATLAWLGVPNAWVIALSQPLF